MLQEPMNVKHSKQEIERLRSQVMDIPMVIGGKEVRTGNLVPIHPPHDRKHLLGHFHKGDASSCTDGH